jgi:hypothetical protein
MEQQYANTPQVTRKLPHAAGQLAVFAAEPEVSAGEFLAETESLYAFY